MAIPSKTPEIPFMLLDTQDSSWAKIFHQLCKLMNDEMVLLIAKADYGYKQDICSRALKEIITTQKFPIKPDFILIECLELTRWTRPKNSKQLVITAFASMLLLILEEETEYSDDSENETLIVFLNCVLSLKIQLTYIQEFIVWKILSKYKREKQWCLEEGESIEEMEITIDISFIYVLLLVMIFNKQKENEIQIVVDWLMNMDAFNKNSSAYSTQEREDQLEKHKAKDNYGQSLAGLTNHTQRHHLWKEISEKMLQKIAFIHSDELVIKLNKIVHNITMKEL